MFDKLLRKLYNVFNKSGKQFPQTELGGSKKMPEITKEVIAVMEANAPLNMEKATVIAEQFGFDSYRSITASAKRNGIPYENKARVAKNGKPVTNKTELVSAIAEVLNKDLEGLDKATKQSLENLSEAVFALAGDLETEVENSDVTD